MSASEKAMGGRRRHTGPGATATEVTVPGLPPGGHGANAQLAVPFLFQQMFPPWFEGIAMSAIAIGAALVAAGHRRARVAGPVPDGPHVLGEVRPAGEHRGRCVGLGGLWFSPCVGDAAPEGAR